MGVPAISRNSRAIGMADADPNRRRADVTDQSTPSRPEAGADEPKPAWERAKTTAPWVRYALQNCPYGHIRQWPTSSSQNGKTGPM